LIYSFLPRRVHEPRTITKLTNHKGLSLDETAQIHPVVNLTAGCFLYQSLYLLSHCDGFLEDFKRLIHF